jgi:DNA-binding NarL/FixJ family response regulator
MPPHESMSLLAVGMRTLPEETRGIDLRSAETAREVIAMMRLVDFDLLLAGPAIPDMNVWSMIRRIRSVHSDQKWVLVNENLTPTDEIQARTLGVLAIFDTTPDCLRLCELAGRLMDRRAVSTRKAAMLTMNLSAMSPAG